MSDVKRTAPSSRGGRKKPRTKSDKESLVAPVTAGSADGADEEGPEAEVPGAPRQDTREMDRDDTNDVPARKEDERRARTDRDYDEEDDRDYPEDDDEAAPVRAPAVREPERGARPEGRETEPRAAHQGSPGPRREMGAPRFRPVDEYAFQVYYDKNARHFAGYVLEIPEVKATGYDRQEVMDELETRLESHIQSAKRKSDIPEAFITRRYPERLEVRISPALYRRLDVLSRLDKIPMDQLVSELLAGAMERRMDTPTKAGGAPHSHPHHNQHHQERRPHNQERSGNRQQQHGGHGNRQGGQGGQGGRGRNYQDTMNNRENFMEYVRSLEKGGPGGWRKK